MRIRPALWLSGLVLTACSPAPAPVASAPAFNPDDPTVVAAIDSMIAAARDAADDADADRALAALNAVDEVTFLTGGVLLTGKAYISNAFKETYADIRRQKHIPIARKVRLLAPDVALFEGLARGTYQTKTGEISDPVAVGTTALFVRKDGQWRLVHFHQSFED